MIRADPDKRREAAREAARRYRQTEKGREAQRRYNQTEKGREAKRRRDRRDSQTEKFRERRRRYRQTEKYRETARRQDARWRWLSHHITPEQAAWLLAEQEGRCPVRGEPLTPRITQVEHDHACCSGQWSCGRCIRGLVCPPCNILVSWVERGEMSAPEVDAYLTRGHVQFPPTDLEGVA